MDETRVVLVGESNPYGSDPRFALYPAPDGCSGHRLCRLILGMRRSEYLKSFTRVNLCVGGWDSGEAASRASELLSGGGKFILLGGKVCLAFGVPFVPVTLADEVLLRLPHPSGLNRLWNRAGIVEQVRSAVRSFAPHLAGLVGAADVGDED